MVYPQGSMAINATIGACLDRDEFDIDTIAQLIPRPGRSPQQALDQLYLAIKGAKGSRYYDCFLASSFDGTLLLRAIERQAAEAAVDEGGKCSLCGALVTDRVS